MTSARNSAAPPLTSSTSALIGSRVARDRPSLPAADISEDRSLAEVSARVAKGVVCLLSALRVHETGTQAPFEVWIAIP